jgi:prepilin-type N-terminal cleavage/methylation domain-containing protein
VDSEAGFTLPELSVSMIVVGIMLMTLYGYVTYYFTQVTRRGDFVQMTNDSQNLLRATVEQLRYGAGVRQSNTISDSNAPAGGWNTSNSSFVIVIAVPATDSSHNYIVDPGTGGPYLNELVYYKSGTSLYKRALSNPSASGNTFITSCPASKASVSCPTDSRLIDNLNSMVFTLYDQDSAVTVDPLQARSINISLGLKKVTFGDPLTLNNSIRVTLRNTF